MSKKNQTPDIDLQAFMNKVKAAEAGNKLDLSSDEDLSIGIMNLLPIKPAKSNILIFLTKSGK